MAEGGTLVLTEKIAQSAPMERLYHDFKRRQGMSDEQISHKKAQIVGVLVPFPLIWYFTVLQDIGFAEVQVLHAEYNFVTLMAVKRAKGRQ
jgi:tRNA (cmo5U34)-methyltransferase